MDEKDLKVGDVVRYDSHGGHLIAKVIKYPLTFPWQGCAYVEVISRAGTWLNQCAPGARYHIAVWSLKPSDVTIAPTKTENTAHFCVTCGYTEVPTPGVACKWCMG